MLAQVLSRSWHHSRWPMRPRNREAMEAELDAHKPSHILCAAGLTGRPNVDWCEANQVCVCVCLCVCVCVSE